MNIIGIIPARMSSSRFPGKPLAKILGKEMLYHVYWRSKMARRLTEVYIATCDNRIRDYCLKNRMNVVMTKSAHKRASDRTREAMVKIEKDTGKIIDIVVMVQGDEPMVHPEMIEEAIEPMIRNKGIQIVNLMAPSKTRKEQNDYNAIKVVVDKDNFALYFSRAPIPASVKGVDKIPVFKQVCIIPFRREFLLKFGRLIPTPLEKAESIDMLRIIEHGYKVKMVLTKTETHSVDTVSDLCLVEKLMKKDSLAQKYIKS